MISTKALKDSLPDLYKSKKELEECLKTNQNSHNLAFCYNPLQNSLKSITEIIKTIEQTIILRGE